MSKRKDLFSLFVLEQVACSSSSIIVHTKDDEDGKKEKNASSFFLLSSLYFLNSSFWSGKGHFITSKQIKRFNVGGDFNERRKKVFFIFFLKLPKEFELKNRSFDNDDLFCHQQLLKQIFTKLK